MKKNILKRALCATATAAALTAYPSTSKAITNPQPANFENSSIANMNTVINTELWLLSNPALMGYGRTRIAIPAADVSFYNRKNSVTHFDLVPSLQISIGQLGQLGIAGYIIDERMNMQGTNKLEGLVELPDRVNKLIVTDKGLALAYAKKLSLKDIIEISGGLAFRGFNREVTTTEYLERIKAECSNCYHPSGPDSPNGNGYALDAGLTFKKEFKYLDPKVGAYFQNIISNKIKYDKELREDKDRLRYNLGFSARPLKAINFNYLLLATEVQGLKGIKPSYHFGASISTLTEFMDATIQTGFQYGYTDSREAYYDIKRFTVGGYLTLGGFRFGASFLADGQFGKQVIIGATTTQSFFDMISAATEESKVKK